MARWRDKSGIRRFYRRVWKIFFYERRDKERERGVLEMGGRSYIFLKSFEGVEENSKFYGGMYFWDYGVGREKNRERIGGFLGYVWEGM